MDENKLTYLSIEKVSNDTLYIVGALEIEGKQEETRKTYTIKANYASLNKEKKFDFKKTRMQNQNGSDTRKCKRKIFIL